MSLAQVRAEASYVLTTYPNSVLGGIRSKIFLNSLPHIDLDSLFRTRNNKHLFNASFEFEDLYVLCLTGCRHSNPKSKMSTIRRTCIMGVADIIRQKVVEVPGFLEKEEVSPLIRLKYYGKETELTRQFLNFKMSDYGHTWALFYSKDGVQSEI